MNTLDSKAQLSEQCITFLQVNSLEFANTIKASLKEFMFENRYTIHPRRIQELSRNELDGFVNFLKEQEITPVVERGKRRAEEGLGLPSVLALGHNFRQFFLDEKHHWDKQVGAVIGLIDEYMTAYLSGFIAAREDYILKEQAKLRTAYEKARDKKDDTT